MNTLLVNWHFDETVHQMASVREERVAVQLIGSGYSDRAEILGLIIDFFLLRTLRNLYKNKIRGDTEIGQNIIIFQFWTNHGRSRPLNEKLSWFRLTTII